MFNYHRKLGFFCALFTMIIVCALATFAQETAFTYQGRFTDAAVTQPTNGTYTMKFRLYDSLTGGTQSGNEQTASVSVVNGVFTTSLDFGATPFAGGQSRWLEIQVGTVTLTPRQKIGSAPYAQRAINSTNADALSENCVLCVTSAQIVSLDAAKITGTVADATNAVNAVTSTTATTAQSINATSGDSVVSAINNGATTGKISSNRLSSDVVLINPSTTQTPTATSEGSTGLLNLSSSFSACNNTNQNYFRINFDGGLLSGSNNGSACSGFIPAEGAGTRLLWYAGKGAFRAGTIDGTQWDDANIGDYSVAFGYNTRSSASYAFSAGERTVAAQSWSLAIGRYNTASGASSVAFGEGAHTNARQGSFVFADRSYTGNICDTGTLQSPYGLMSSGCTATGNVNTIVRAPFNNSFTVRASGGTSFYTNATSTTGLQLSTLNSSNVLYGSFVWADRSSDTQIVPTAQNQTIFRSSNGFTIYTNSAASSGVTLTAGGGSWNSVSDRNMKENFAVVDRREILRKVLNLPISTWNYKTQNASVRHIGAMAQDFYRLFGVGEDDKRIATIDPDGVAFAAIQGLNEELKDRDVKIDAQQKTIESQQKQLNALSDQIKKQQAAIESLTKLFCAANPAAEICKP